MAAVSQLAQLAVQLTGSAETELQAQSTEMVAIYNESETQRHQSRRQARVKTHRKECKQIKLRKKKWVAKHEVRQ